MKDRGRRTGPCRRLTSSAGICRYVGVGCEECDDTTREAMRVRYGEIGHGATGEGRPGASARARDTDMIGRSR
ncbi:hypothetical protein Psi01_77150 [Planobispora siamensis]|uniref:Uncharacterized protein n=1 Tax=Planobispora siamensis TaxID=936338 RepID=A0A8J3WPM9_9ACTN|nr:hypothetical protein Psi01_77150 [Planobispora siamensis]